MNKLKKITKMQLFLSIFSMLLVMLINVLFDVIDGKHAWDFFSISIKNEVLYGRIIDILNRGSEIAILAIGMTLVVSASAGTDISVGSVMSLAGGVGNVIGTLFGVMINGTISSLVKFNGKLVASWANIITAVLLCFFILLQAIFAKLKESKK